MFNSNKKYFKTRASLEGRVETEFRAHQLQPCNFPSGNIENPETQNGAKIRDRGRVNSKSPLFTYILFQIPTLGPEQDLSQPQQKNVISLNDTICVHVV